MAGVSVNVYVPSAFTLTGGSLTLPSLTSSTYTLRCTVSVAPGGGGLPPAVVRVAWSARHHSDSSMGAGRC
jgi:hypothetical protein